MRWRAARRLRPSSRRPNRSVPTTRFWRRSRRSRRPACRRHRCWRRSCALCSPLCSRFPARRRRKAASWSGCRPMPADWCAFGRSMRRPETMLPRCWRVSKSTRPRPTLRPRSPISASSPTSRARRRRAGLKGPKRARPRSRPPVNTPPIRRARSGHGEGAMIRLILFLLAVAVLAAGFAWVADRPGDVVITWMGYHIETSLMVAALAIVVLVLVLMLLWAIVRGILRSPEQVSVFFRHRRAMKGYLAISRGLIAIGAGDLRSARKSAEEAVRLAPDLVPAAALAGRRLAEAGETRKARKILEKAWTINPHPDIAEAYANLRLGDSARDRLARMHKLAAKVPGQLEGALAVARAAFEAREFAGARSELAPYLSAPTRRVATLMAEIEESEHGDEGRVREWMGRAMRAAGDPVWTADGVVSERWLPVSPNGRLDGFTWKLPLAEIGVTRPVIEVAPPPLRPAAVHTG